MKTSALLSAALLSLLFSGTATQMSHGNTGESCGSRNHFTTGSEETPITVVVKNNITGDPPSSYPTSVRSGGILLSGLMRLQYTTDFRFTYIQDPNYGPYLEGVNGLHRSLKDHTYWELLVEKPDHTTIRLGVGIGCYIPAANDRIILNYNKY
ncbi:transcobalamin-1-like [Sphaeramia orbicularis]|uniref:transcobalamin-1-like n=1 Tax=Sphaeramia orbicularis TaxID=375764 RepID=UPI00117F8BC2|nr:transcobalamin-1-like [Sphaeramia orbicularis]XP_029988922.1 transcobalamin-1-like [Sphaeramia orbicularis]